MGLRLWEWPSATDERTFAPGRETGWRVEYVWYATGQVECWVEHEPDDWRPVECRETPESLTEQVRAGALVETTRS